MLLHVKQQAENGSHHLLLQLIKVVKADLGVTGKPSNLHKYNMSVQINIYNENEACVSHIRERVREEMGDQSLLLVGSNRLMFLDQEATKGKLIKVLHSTSFNICTSSRIISLLILKKTIIFKLFCSKVISSLTWLHSVKIQAFSRNFPVKKVFVNG